MKEKKFIKKVVNKIDIMLEKHDDLDVNEWVLYNDYPYVEIEDIRHKDIRRQPDFKVDISEFIENEDIKNAAKKVIRQIETRLLNEEEYKEESEYEDDEDLEDDEYDDDSDYDEDDEREDDEEEEEEEEEEENNEFSDMNSLDDYDESNHTSDSESPFCIMIEFPSR